MIGRWALGLSLLVAGCVTADPARWSGTPTSTVKTAIVECKDRVDQQTAWAAGFGGAIVPLGALFQRSGEFDRCMDAKGYQKGE